MTPHYESIPMAGHCIMCGNKTGKWHGDKPVCTKCAKKPEVVGILNSKNEKK